MADRRTTILLLLFYWLCSVDIKTGIGVLAQQSSPGTSVEVTAPLNPVKENDILSVHCKIRGKTQDHKVTISRVVNDTRPNGEKIKLVQELTNDNSVIFEPDKTRNRMFIAKRLLKDGSNVYFLSLTDVTRADEGPYTCSVIQNINNIVADGHVPISIQYFPTEAPTCTSTFPGSISEIDVLERQELVFTCSSPVGNPAVNIVWIKASENTSPSQAAVTEGNVRSSNLTLKPTLADDGGIWQCEVRSNVFRKEVNRCHIGPIRVRFNPTPAPPTLVTTTPPVLTSPYHPTNPPLTEECREFCRLEQEPTIFYWTIATVIAGILAVVFLIMGIIILIKYCMALHSAKHDRGRGSRGRPDLVSVDDVDAGVEFRRDDNRVYMSLDRSGRLQTEPLYQARGEIIGAHYILTPTRGDDGERQYIVTPTRDRPGPSTSQTEAVYQGGVVLERQVVGTPMRGELERQQYIAGPLRDPAERQQQYIATPIQGERPQYIATPIGGAEMPPGMGPIGPQYTATPGTPSRGELGRQQYIAAQKLEAAGGAVGGVPALPPDRQQYIATPALSEGERQYIVTPSQGGGMERHYLDTPTLPPRRYRSQYV